ncbi:hypothetical protein STEG23_032453, partial [Scotinomys teguina]
LPKSLHFVGPEIPRMIRIPFTALMRKINKDAVPGDGEQIWKEQVSSVKARAESLEMGMVQFREIWAPASVGEQQEQTWNTSWQFGLHIVCRIS